MRSRLVTAALLLSMLLQTVSMGGYWAGSRKPSDALHAVLHWSGILHHHDHEVTHAEVAAGGERARIALQAKQLPQPQSNEDFEAFAVEFAQVTLHPDQSYHRDLSLDSRHHLGIDACMSVVALIPSMPVSPVMDAPTDAPVAAPQVERVDPFLAGPRRPPRGLS